MSDIHKTASSYTLVAPTEITSAEQADGADRSYLAYR